MNQMSDVTNSALSDSKNILANTDSNTASTPAPKSNVIDDRGETQLSSHTNLKPPPTSELSQGTVLEKHKICFLESSPENVDLIHTLGSMIDTNMIIDPEAEDTPGYGDPPPIALQPEEGYTLETRQYSLPTIPDSDPTRHHPSNTPAVAQLVSSLNRKVEAKYQAPLNVFSGFCVVKTLPSTQGENAYLRHFSPGGVYSPGFIYNLSGKTSFLYPRLKRVVRNRNYRLYNRGQPFMLRDNEDSFVTADKRMILLENNKDFNTAFLAPDVNFPDGIFIFRTVFILKDFKDIHSLPTPLSERQLLAESLEMIEILAKWEIESEITIENQPQWTDLTRSESLFFDDHFHYDDLPADLLVTCDLPTIRRDLIKLANEKNLTDLSDHLINIKDSDLVEILNDLHKYLPEAFSNKTTAIGCPAETISYYASQQDQHAARDQCSTSCILTDGTEMEECHLEDDDIPTQVCKISFIPLEVVRPNDLRSFTDSYVLLGATRTLNTLTTMASRLKFLGHAKMIRGQLVGNVNTTVRSARPLRSNENAGIPGNVLQKTSWREMISYHVNTEFILWVDAGDCSRASVAFLKDVNRLIIYEHIHNELNALDYRIINGALGNLSLNESVDGNGRSLVFGHIFTNICEIDNTLKGPSILVFPPYPLHHPLNIFDDLPDIATTIAKLGGATMQLANAADLHKPGFASIKVKIGLDGIHDEFPLPSHINISAIPGNLNDKPMERYTALTKTGTINPSVARHTNATGTVPQLSGQKIMMDGTPKNQNLIQNTTLYGKQLSTGGSGQQHPPMLDQNPPRPQNWYGGKYQTPTALNADGMKSIPTQDRKVAFANPSAQLGVINHPLFYGQTYSGMNSSTSHNSSVPLQFPPIQGSGIQPVPTPNPPIYNEAGRGRGRKSNGRGGRGRGRVQNDQGNTFSSGQTPTLSPKYVKNVHWLSTGGCIAEPPVIPQGLFSVPYTQSTPVNWGGIWSTCPVNKRAKYKSFLLKAAYVMSNLEIAVCGYQGFHWQLIADAGRFNVHLMLKDSVTRGTKTPARLGCYPIDWE